LIALHYHSQCYCGHSIVLIPETFHLLLSVTIIGQGSLLLLPLSCLLKAMFLVNSRSPRFYAPSLDSLLSNLLSHFAEFLKDISSLTFVFSTCSLVSVWYSSFPRFFLICFLVSHYPSFSGFLDLGAAFSLLLELPVSFFTLIFVTHLASSLSIFYELICYLFLSFGRVLSRLYSWRRACLLMHCYVFFFCWLFPGLLL